MAAVKNRDNTFMDHSVEHRHSRLIREFWTMVRYGLVGAGNTGVFLLAVWLLRKTGWHYSAYTAIAYAVAILFSFIMNMVFTFRQSGQPVLPLFLRFLTVTLGLMGLVQLIQLALIEGLGWPEMAGVITGMVFYTGVGYFINRLWVFRGIGRQSSRRKSHLTQQ